MAIVKNRSRGKRGPFQISADLDALKPDPGVGPGLLFVRFIVDKLIRTDQEGIAFFQPVHGVVDPVVSLSSKDIVDQISAAQDRAIAVAWLAGLIAAGVYIGIKASEIIIGKNKIFHKGTPFRGICVSHKGT